MISKTDLQLQKQPKKIPPQKHLSLFFLLYKYYSPQGFRGYYGAINQYEKRHLDRIIRYNAVRCERNVSLTVFVLRSSAPSIQWRLCDGFIAGGRRICLGFLNGRCAFSGPCVLLISLCFFVLRLIKYNSLIVITNEKQNWGTSRNV